MPSAEHCEPQNLHGPGHFIGYSRPKSAEGEAIRIFLNCADETRYEQAVDVIFPKQGGFEFRGVNTLPAIKKFNRLINALEKRAREENVPREKVFESATRLKYFLSRIKNSREFKDG